MAMEQVELDNMEMLMDKPRKEGVKGPNKFERIIQPCVAELIGTTFFVFIGRVSVIENVEPGSRLQPALAHGLVLAALVACLAEISDSHFNPPFTMAIYLCGGIELLLVVPYIVSQLAGGVLGAVMAKLMTTEGNYARAQGAAFTVLQSDEQLGQAVFGEMAMTCLLTVVVLLGAVNSKTKSFILPFLVGCTVITNVLVGANVSGTCLNPARALGPAIITNYWTYHWVYWVGPTAGSLVAVALVRLLLGDQKMRMLFK